MKESIMKEKYAGIPYNKLAWALCFGAVILFYALNYLTPMLADDYGYSEGMDSVTAVAQKTYDMFTWWNGRIVANFLSHFWLFAGKPLFNIANVFVYCLFVYLFQFHITGKTRFNPVMFLAVNIFLWFFVPVWGQNFLWICGGSVYFWTATFILLFLVPFRKKMLDDGYNLNIPLSVLSLFTGLLAGNSAENSAAAVLILLVSYFAVKVTAKKKIALFEVLGALGFLTGFLLLASSSMGGVRHDELQHYGSENFMLIKRLAGVTLIFGKDLGFALLAACAVLVYDLTRNKKRKVNAFTYFYAIAAFTGAFSMLVSPTFPPRAFLIVTVFAGIALGSVLWQMEIKTPQLVKRNAALILTCCFIGLSFSFLNTSRNFIGVYMEWNRRVKHIEAEKAKGNLDVEVRSPIPVWDKRVAAYGLQDIKHDPDAFPNRFIAEYFGLSSIRKNDDDGSWEVMWFK